MSATPLPARNSTPRLMALVLAVNVGALIVFLLSPRASEYPLAALSIMAFLFAQAFFPACRLCEQAPLCPSNIAQGFFWLQLVLVTVLVGFWGFQPGTLPYLPAQDALHTAILIRVAAYLAFCAAYEWMARRRRIRVSDDDAPTPTESAPFHRPAEARLIVPYTVLGLIGFFLTFGGIQGLVEYLTTPSAHNIQVETTLALAAGTFLRYFLGFAIVLSWSLWIARQEPSRNRAGCVLATAAAFILLMIANLSYNRGSMLGPAMALAAAFSAHVARIPFKAVVLSAGLALFAALAVGWYRSSEIETHAIGSDQSPSEHFVEFIQIYASAPQLGAFMIENLEREGHFYFGSTLLPSLAYPIPVVGRPLRESSGVYLFNAFIYGDTEVLDQNFPLDTELYVNFHIVGVLLGFGLLGCILNWYQFRFLSAPNAIESYCWMTLGLWTVFPGSLSVASQMFVYAFWPIYGYFAFKALARARTSVRPAWRRTVAALSSGKAGKV